MIIDELAGSLLQLDQRPVRGLDRQIAATFRRHHQAATIESMPGFGPILGAQLLVAARPPRLPQRRPPGRRSRPGARPQRLWSTIRQPAQTAPLQPTAAARVLSVRANRMKRAGPNRAYYLKKRAGGHTHAQAVIALARRRIDVLWAPLRDDRTFSVDPPSLAAAA
jgi:hypothetical protein